MGTTVYLGRGEVVICSVGNEVLIIPAEEKKRIGLEACVRSDEAIVTFVVENPDSAKILVEELEAASNSVLRQLS